MKIEFLNAKQVGKKLNELIISTDEFHCAVAWATEMDFAKKLFDNSSKIKKFIVGIDFAQTSDKFLETLQHLQNVRYMPNNGNKTFHPKIYYFENGDDAFALIGSSNCTIGGFSNNEEASLLIQGAKNHSTFKEIRNKIESWYANGLKITPEFLEKYKRIKASFKKQNENRQLNTELEKLSYSPTIAEFDIENAPRIHIAWYTGGDIEKDKLTDEKIYDEILDSNTFLEDDEINMGDIVLNWKCNVKGVPHKTKRLSFFRVDKIISNGYEEENEYTKLVYQEKNSHKLFEPFQLDKKTQKSIKDVLESNWFKDIFHEYEDWKSPKQEDVKEFLRHVQSDYKKSNK